MLSINAIEKELEKAAAERDVLLAHLIKVQIELDRVRNDLKTARANVYALEECLSEAKAAATRTI